YLVGVNSYCRARRVTIAGAVGSIAIFARLLIYNGRRRNGDLIGLEPALVEELDYAVIFLLYGLVQVGQVVIGNIECDRPDGDIRRHFTLRQTLNHNGALH